MRKTFWLLLSVVLVTQSQIFPISDGGKSLSSYFTLVSGVSYTMNFSMGSNAIDAGSTIQLQFTNRFTIDGTSLANCAASTSSTVVHTSVLCSASFASGTSTYAISFSNVYLTNLIAQTFFSLKFQITNPYGQTNEQISVFILNSVGTVVGSGTSIVSYTASPLNSCTLSSSSPLTGAPSTYTITFSPSQKLLANSYLIITMPLWFISTTSHLVSSSLSCVGNAGTDSTPLCNFQTISGSETINITNFISTNRTAASVSISFSTLYNPWSLAPYGPVTFQFIFSQSLVSQSCSNSFLTVTQLNTMRSMAFPITNTAISGLTSSIRLIGAPFNPVFASGSLLTITYPASITLVYSGSRTVVNQTPTSITFSGFTAANLSPAAGSFNFNAFTITNPPSTRTFTMTFTTLYTQNSINYGSDTISNIYKCTAGILTASLMPSTTRINANANFVFTITTANALVIGSMIIVTLPVIVNTISNCVTSTASNCALTTTTATATLTTALPAASTFTFTVPVINPSSVITTSSASISTFYDANLDSLVDSIATGMTITATPNPITVAAVNPLSRITYASTSYQFTATLIDPILPLGYINILFPSPVTLSSPTLTAASFPTTFCIVNIITTTTVSITNCFPSTGLSDLALSITIAGVINPPSLASTPSFSLTTYGPSGIINSISTGLIATMNTAATMPAFTLTPFLSTVAATTTYTLQATLTSTYSTNSFFVLTIPSSMAYIGTVCTSCTISSNNLTITLTSPSSTTYSVTLTSLRNYDIPTTVSFTLNIFSSNGFLSETATPFPITYLPTTLSAAIIANNGIALNEISTLTLSITTSFTIQPSFNTALTSLKIVVPSELTLLANTSCTGCVVALPSTITIAAVGLGLTAFTLTINNVLLPSIVGITSFAVQHLYNAVIVASVSTGIMLSAYCTTPCQKCSSSPTICVSCLPAPNTFIYYNNSACLQGCPSAFYPDTTNHCVACTPPCSNCSAPLVCLTCTANFWLSVSSCVNPCPNTFFNSSNGQCVTCSPPCGNCLTALLCTSCLTGFLSANSCVPAANCPTNTFPNTTSSVCQQCTPPCSSCSLSPTNCTACIAPQLYYSFLCYPSCPNLTYQGTTTCISCTPPCLQCSGANVCISCLTDYFLSGSCVPAANCPTTTYPNSTLLRCVTCSPPCQTCSLTPLNCTSCIQPKLYYSLNCFVSCPNLTYQSGLQCVDCSAPCLACTSANFCLSCQSNFLTNGQCLSAINCPLNTYANATTLKCEGCPVGCSACSSSTICSQCNSPLVFYSNGCLSSCPDGTYTNSNNNCIPCSTPCLYCQQGATNCTACLLPLFFSVSSCVPKCPDGTYPTVGVCAQCSAACRTCSVASSCDNCISGLFYSNGQCQTTCPSGTYRDTVNNNCSACDATCASCSATANNCTGCAASLLYFDNSCSSFCPLQYFNVSGVCVTCSLCSNCINATHCATCLPSYFIYQSICYTKCPPSAPISNSALFSCIACSASCRDCTNQSTLCTSCYSQTYLLNYECLSNCPTAFIADVATGTCIKPSLGNTIYFPCTFAFIILLIITTFSKCHFPETNFITTIAALLSLCSYLSWLILIFVLTFIDYSFDASTKLIMLYICAAVVAVSFLIGLTFNCYFHFNIAQAKGFKGWKRSKSARCVFWLVSVISCLEAIFFRLIYSQLLKRDFFSAYFGNNGRQLIRASNKVSLAAIVLNFLPMSCLCGAILYLKSSLDQTVLSALDTLVITALMIVFVVIDAAKDAKDFATAKGRNYEDIGSESSSIIENAADKPYCISEVPQNLKDSFFAKITWADQNKFPHLNKQSLRQQTVESLPQSLSKYKQYDPLEDAHLIVDDLIFYQHTPDYYAEKEREIQKERRDAENKRIKEDRIRNQQQEIGRKRREQDELQQERRKKRQAAMEEDQRQQQNLLFMDIVALDRVESQQIKKSPLAMLSKYKKIQDRNVDEKSLNKLLELAKRNNLKPEFMKETFGIEKYYNLPLLTSIIDIHNHFPRERIAQMFDPNSDVQILRKLMGKHAKLDTQKLRDLVSGERGQQIVKALTGPNAVVTSQVAYELFWSESKYSRQFITNLLLFSPDKIRALLHENGPKTLQALKRIAGEHLQHQQTLENLAGVQSALQSVRLAKVVNQLSQKAITNLFGSKSKRNDTLIDRILNNPKIGLKQLNPILETEQILDELDEALSEANVDPQIAQNILNLFKNNADLNPELVQKFLSNPQLLTLLQSPIDASFLSNLLGLNSKADLNLLQEAVQLVPRQKLAEVLKYAPERNLDFAAIASLFDANDRTDPNLVAQMLDPEIIAELYTRNNNDPKILQKLVQEGRQFDKQDILNIYGKHYQKVYGVTVSDFNNLSLPDFTNNQMSRTQGRFLSPIALHEKPLQQQFESEENITKIQQPVQEPEQRISRRKNKKRQKKKSQNIRLPSEKIYLQRIQAPHQHANKAQIRTKKKAINQSASKLIMDQFNDVFDTDF